jgi:uncharacterized protein
MPKHERDINPGLFDNSWRIDPDTKRYKEIVKEAIRGNIKRHINHNDLVGRKGKDLVSIPLPEVELPSFRFNSRQKGGMGMGPGNIGDPVWSDQDENGDTAGNEPGRHIYVDVEVDELLDILMLQLELPLLSPRNAGYEMGLAGTVKGITESPTPWLDRRRSYRRALARYLDLGNSEESLKEVFTMSRKPGVARYRSFGEKIRHKNQAVLFIKMDVSGSMGYDARNVVSRTGYWAELLLKRQYQNLEIVRIAHDVNAAVIDHPDEFYKLNAAGGTRISSSYELMDKLIKEKYDPSLWNIYAIHGSDGDVWDSSDIETTANILVDLVPVIRSFNYLYTPTGGRSGDNFYAVMSSLAQQFPPSEVVGWIRTAIAKDEDQIYNALLTFFGKGQGGKLRKIKGK